MTTIIDRLRAAAETYTDSVQTPPVETIYARAERSTPRRPAPKTRRLRRGLIVGVLALAVTVPAAAAAGLRLPFDPLAGLNPDSKAGPATSPLPRIPAGSQQVKGGYITLTVVPGTHAGRSCSSLAMHDGTSSSVVATVVNCGGGEHTANVSAIMGVSLIYANDPGARRIRVVYPGGSFDASLIADYYLSKQLPPGPATITTINAAGDDIATHHLTIPER